MDSDTWA